MEASLIPSLIDRMIQIPDAASIATIHWLEGKMRRKCGASTGTNLFGALVLAKEKMSNNERGSIVTMICDSGERYLDSYFDQKWIEDQGLDLSPYLNALERLAAR